MCVCVCVLCDSGKMSTWSVNAISSLVLRSMDGYKKKKKKKKKKTPLFLNQITAGSFR